MSEKLPPSPNSSIGKPVGRRGWFKQAGATVAGIALGSGLHASTEPGVVKSARTTGLKAGSATRSATRRRGIDCGFDEGPI